MARKPRIHYPGALYHVMLRGNNAQAVFLNSLDRRNFYSLLEEGVERFGYRIHGFCLMTNHIHLAIQVGNIPLSKLLHNLTFRYTQWFNKNHQHIGHLFQGRYKAILVEHDSYLLELVRYIHLNPVRAKLENMPQDYLWSGHRAYLGIENLKWLTTDWLLSQLSLNAFKARQQYQKLVMSAIDKEDLTFNLIINPKVYSIEEKGRFIENANQEDIAKKRIKRQLSTEDVIVLVCKHYNITKEELFGKNSSHLLSKIRAIIAWLCLEYDIDKLTNLSKLFGREPSALSHGIKKINFQHKKEAKFLAKQIGGQA